jgi:glutathione S-transferase
MASSPKTTITYFDFPGRIETARLAHHIAGIPFVDDRIQVEDWPALKPKTPFGQVPTISVDGDVYAQSKAIARYAGRLAGLYPAVPTQAMAVDMLLESIDEIADLHIVPTVKEADPEKKRAMRQVLVKDVLPGQLNQFDRVVGRQNPNYAVGDCLTIADLKVFNFSGWLNSGKSYATLFIALSLPSYFSFSGNFTTFFL